MKFRKKQVIVEAKKFTYPPTSDLIDWMGKAAGNLTKARHIGAKAEMHVKTLEDGVNNEVKHIASEGDWIIKGIKGEFYPCKPDIFELTYEKAE